MPTLPERSFRLYGRPSNVLDAITGEPGEFFFDTTANSLRIYDGDAFGGELMANRTWVENNAVVASVQNGVYTTGSYSDPTWITSLSGSKISGNISGNAGTVTNGVYTTGSYSDPSWITTLSATKIVGTVASAATVPNAVFITDTGTVTNTMLAGGITADKLVTNSLTLGSSSLTLGSTTTSLSGLTSVSSSSFNGPLTGNASTATALQNARTINGVSFDGTANITITVNANNLIGTTLNSGIINSSLTSVGTLTTLNISGQATVGGTALVQGEVTVNNDVTVSGNVIVDTVPTSKSHATNKRYVDSRATALSIALS